MAFIKNAGIALLEELCFIGPGTRKELWDRTQLCDWPRFKRLFSLIKAEELIEESPLQQDVNPGLKKFQLTKLGEEFVQSMQ
jgi:hypothetical protein